MNFFQSISSLSDPVPQIRYNQIFFHKQRYGFNMIGVWKHIHRCHFQNRITRCKHLKIPGKGCRIAGNINDFLRRMGQHMPHYIFVHTYPGRINNNHIRFFRHQPENILDIPFKKRCSCQCRLNSHFPLHQPRPNEQFQSRIFFCLAGKPNGNGPGARIEIQNSL